MAKRTRKQRQRMSEAAKLRWQKGKAQECQDALKVNQGRKRLRGPKVRRDSGQQPLPVDNYYLERDGQPPNPLPPLPLKPAQPFTTLWSLGNTVQAAGVFGITLRALAQEVYGYCAREEQERCRKAVAFLVNRRYYPIVRTEDGRYVWHERLVEEP